MTGDISLAVGVSILSLLVSAISLCVSLYTVWRTRLAPFKLTIKISGRVAFVGNINEEASPTLIVPLVFSNSGATPSFLEDLAIAFRPRTKGRDRLFRAMFEQANSPNYAAEKVNSPEWPAFHSFRMKGEEVQTRQVVFVEYRPDARARFQTGNFEIVVYARHSACNEAFVQACVAPITIVAEDLAALYPTYNRSPSGHVPLLSKMTDDCSEAFTKLVERVSDLPK
ncbi:MAG TPA: hypothetical protein PK999_18920 [Nitrospira sp.]|nr:hypothetical protein [Rhodocyclaceae bacterium]HNC85131.1 hypothetical protein [Nitrospira sp.]